MRHSLWWLLGQFAIVMASGAVVILAVVAVWYGLSFAVLATVSRVFRLRGRAGIPADHDPTGGAHWASSPRRWTMSREDVKQARARLSVGDRHERDRTCANDGHAWTETDTEAAQEFCGRCYRTRT